MSTSPNRSIPIHTYISGAVLKKNNKRKLGISFVSRPEDKVVYIRRVTGAFRKYTDLVPCLKILSVNGQNISTASDAEDIIRNAPIGLHVQVIAEGCCTKLIKSSRFASCSSLGISLEQVVGRKDLVRVSNVQGAKQHLMLSGLQVGSILISINGRSITSVSQAKWLLRLHKKLTLVSVQSFCDAKLPRPTLEQHLRRLDSQSCEEDKVIVDPAVSLIESITRHRRFLEQQQEDQRAALQQQQQKEQTYPPKQQQQRQQEQDMEAIVSDDDPDEEVETPISMHYYRRQQQQRQQQQKQYYIDKDGFSVCSDESGLPDAVLNLQIQDELRDEALASFLDGQSELLPNFDFWYGEQQQQRPPKNISPKIFNDDDDDTDADDLLSFLSKDSKDRELAVFEDTELAGEVEYLTTMMPINNNNKKEEEEGFFLSSSSNSKEERELAAFDGTELAGEVEEGFFSKSVNFFRPTTTTTEQQEGATQSQREETEENQQHLLQEQQHQEMWNGPEESRRISKEDQQPLDDDTELVGEIEYMPKEGFFSKSVNFFRIMEQVSQRKKIDDEEEGEEGNQQEQQQQQQQQQQQEFPGRPEESMLPIEVNKETPSSGKRGGTSTGGTNNNNNKHAASTTKTRGGLVPKNILPAQVIHVLHLDDGEDLASVLTEDNDDDDEEEEKYEVGTLSKHQQLNNNNTIRKRNDNVGEEEEKNRLQCRHDHHGEEEPYYTAVGETNRTENSIFFKGFKCVQEFVSDAASCDSSSQKYSPTCDEKKYYIDTY